MTSVLCGSFLLFCRFTYGVSYENVYQLISAQRVPTSSCGNLVSSVIIRLSDPTGTPMGSGCWIERPGWWLNMNAYFDLMFLDKCYLIIVKFLKDYKEPNAQKHSYSCGYYTLLKIHLICSYILLLILVWSYSLKFWFCLISN